MKRFLQIVLVVVLIGCMTTACGPALEGFRVVDPASLPPANSYGTVVDVGLSRTKITCLVTFQARFFDRTFNEVTYLIPFDSGGPAYNRGATWDNEWDQVKYDFTEKTLQMADERFRTGLGLSDDLWPNSFEDWRVGFQLYSESDEDVIPVEENPRCQPDWVVTSDLILKEVTPAGDSSWSVGIANPNQVRTTYVTIGSRSGHIEFPLRENELLAILFDTYDPAKAFDEVSFTDPALEVGEGTYESRVLSEATQIQKQGDLVARFSWTSIESQETVLDFAARLLLLKAWASGGTIHNPAFVGFLREKLIAATDISLEAIPVPDSNLIGLSMKYSKTLVTEPAIQGDLYLLSK